MEIWIVPGLETTDNVSGQNNLQKSSEANECPGFAKFDKWLNEAKRTDILEPTAMTLSTVVDGKPTSRVVLLKQHGESGFVFYTNLNSKKSKEIQQNPRVCLNFHWQPLRKQVRIEGVAELVPDEMADKYFASRERKSQIGAWASKQSQHIQDKLELEMRVLKFGKEFGLGKIPRPDFWSGFIVKPDYMEFWQDRSFRLHERQEYKKNASGLWETSKLFP